MYTHTQAHAHTWTCAHTDTGTRGHKHIHAQSVDLIQHYQCTDATGFALCSAFPERGAWCTAYVVALVGIWWHFTPQGQVFPGCQIDRADPTGLNAESDPMNTSSTSTFYSTPRGSLKGLGVLPKHLCVRGFLRGRGKAVCACVARTC